MRTIIFRGKAILNTFSINEEEAKIKIGDWVYGAVIPFDDGIDLIYERDPNNPEICGCHGIEVDHNTIGQFTGLYDENDKEIYEGDIVSIETIKSRINKVVEWNSERACWDAGGENRIDLYAFCYCEVIGNIHDNKELLTQTIKQ